MMPCPFCGAIPDVGIYPETDDSPRGYFCVCPFCSASTAMSSVEAEAIGVWNRRFTAPARGDGDHIADVGKMVSADSVSQDSWRTAAGAEWVLVPREPTQNMVDWGTTAINYDGPTPLLPEPDHDYDADLRRSYRAMIAAAPVAPAGDGWRPTHRHVKRGTVYQKVGEVTLQTEEPLHDDDRCVLYRDEDGRWWARPVKEFGDYRRFEPLPPVPVEEG